MVQKPHIYKLTLACSPGGETGMNLRERIDEVMQAKDEFNARSEARSMVLLQPQKERLHILLRLQEQFHPGHLRDFYSTLAKDYGWQEELKVEEEHMFSVKAIKYMELEQARSLMQSFKKRSPQHYSSLDSKSLLQENNSASEEGFLCLGKARREMHNLLGQDPCKEEMEKLIDLHGKWSKKDPNMGLKEVFPFHYIYTCEDESFGLTTILELQKWIFYHLGLIAHPSYKELNMQSNGFRYQHFFQEEQKGCIVLRQCPTHLNRKEREDLKEMLHKVQDTLIVGVLTLGQDKQNILKELFWDCHLPHRVIHFPAYSREEQVGILKNIFAKYRFSVSSGAEELIEELIDQISEGRRKVNIRSLKELANSLMVQALDAEEEKVPDTISTEHCRTLLQPGSNVSVVSREDPYKELAAMVGLHKVKDRLKELLSFFVMEKRKKELHLQQDKVCLHMQFTGNPGTGKTTVARLLGRILYQEGILAQGELIEVSREDLVGQYVGHTAQKTASVLQGALGNVLFLDEAYALYGGAEQDFGYEAVSTLVKFMEDYKEDLMIILAGYPMGMEELMQMNPGLKDRIPHKVHFPDYSPSELFRIFKKLLGISYILTSGAEEELRHLFILFSEKSKLNFSNGRLARNVAERLKIKQGTRLYEEGISDRKGLMTIKEKDVLALKQDEDMHSLLEKEGRIVGFA